MAATPSRAHEATPFDCVPVPPDLPAGWVARDAAGDEIAAAEHLEYDVFLAAGFCDESTHGRIAEYELWRDVSRFKTVVDEHGALMGTVRVIVGPYDELPVGKFERERAYPPDPVLEYASLAVLVDGRKTGVAEALYRAVWQDALRAGAEGLVAIGEEWLLRILNGTYRFGFEQLGPSHWYMGGECFPMGTSMTDLLVRLRRQPSFFRWVTAEIDLRDLPLPQARTTVGELRRGELDRR